jgi:hypothetical protein
MRFYNVTSRTGSQWTVTLFAAWFNRVPELYKKLLPDCPLKILLLHLLTYPHYFSVRFIYFFIFFFSAASAETSTHVALKVSLHINHYISNWYLADISWNILHIYAYVCIYTFAHALWAIIPSDFLADTNGGLQPLLTIWPVSKHCRLYSTTKWIFLGRKNLFLHVSKAVIYGTIISTSIKLYKSISILLSFDNCVVSIRLSVQLC